MHPKYSLKNEGVIALTSDASIDFTPADFDSPLTMPSALICKSIAVLKSRKYSGASRSMAMIFLIAAWHGADHDAKDYPDADAFITDEKNLPIAIRTADCVPVFIFDPIRRVIGLAHAGWRGTYKEIASKTVQRMQEKYASQPSDLKVVLGPCIRECCYKVNEEFRDYFPSNVKGPGREFIRGYDRCKP